MIEALAVYTAGMLVVMFIVGLTNDPDDTDYIGSTILALIWPLVAVNFAGAMVRAWVRHVRERKEAR